MSIEVYNLNQSTAYDEAPFWTNDSIQEIGWGIVLHSQKNGELVCICHMSDKHLINAINLFKDKYNVKALQDELDKRTPETLESYNNHCQNV